MIAMGLLEEKSWGGEEIKRGERRGERGGICGGEDGGKSKKEFDLLKMKALHITHTN